MRGSEKSVALVSEESSLFDFIVEKRLISRNELSKLLNIAKLKFLDPIDFIVTTKKHDKELFLAVIGSVYGLDYVASFADYKPDIKIFEYLKVNDPFFLMEHKLFALYRFEDEKLVVLTSYPKKIEKLLSQIVVGIDYKIAIAVESDIREVLRLQYRSMAELISRYLPDSFKDFDMNGRRPKLKRELITAGIEKLKNITLENKSQVIQSLIEKISDILVDIDGSAIHVESSLKDNSILIRLKVFGRRIKYRELPDPIGYQVIEYIKKLANLSPSEKKVPKKGELKLKNKDRFVTYKVTSIPVSEKKEDLVLDIVKGDSIILLENLGMTEKQITEINSVISRDRGLLIVTGQEKSGVSTTLHSILEDLTDEDRKTWIIEKRGRYEHTNAKKIFLESNKDEEYLQRLESLSDVDADLVMIDYIYDADIANIATKMAESKLILSAIKGTDTIDPIIKLTDLGVDNLLFAENLKLLISQKLYPVLCPSCKERYTPSIIDARSIVQGYGENIFPELGVEFSKLKLYRPKGCNICRGTGYEKIQGVYEILTINNNLAELIKHKRSKREILPIAYANGMRTVRQNLVVGIIAGTYAVDSLLRS